MAARSEYALVIVSIGFGKTLVVFFYVFDRFFREGGEDIREAYKRKILRIFYILSIKVLGIDV